jgi:hypothetical protein
MWMSLALAAWAGLAPTQASALKLTNVRSVTSYFWPERDADKILPGDGLVLVFDIAGLQADKNGRMLYTMAMEITDSQGKAQPMPPLPDQESYCSLGGNRVPALAVITTVPNQTPGVYTVKVTVMDRANKNTQRFTRKFEVLPKAFGIVQPTTSADPSGRIYVPPGGVVGQTRWITFFVVGFQRDPKSKQPNLSAELRVLDEKGNSVGGKPVMGVVDQDVPENAQHISMQFKVDLNRPGKFVVELYATDRLSTKTAKLSIPLTVSEWK